jgi:hypothetical protein
MTQWVGPEVTVVAIERSSPRSLVTLRFDEPEGPPGFPANLWNKGTDAKWHLDKVVTADDGTLTFETDEDLKALEVGRKYGFQQWWTPEALALVTDLTRHWQRATYPDNGDHDHCPLSWIEISAQPGEGVEHVGYRSGDDWISVGAYERFIRDDHLRVRSEV